MCLKGKTKTSIILLSQDQKKIARIMFQFLPFMTFISANSALEKFLSILNDPRVLSDPKELF